MLMDIHVHGLCIIYPQYQYYQIGFALSLLVRPTERGGRWGYFPGARINRGPRALVNANVDACTASYDNPFYATKMHKITSFSSVFKIFFAGGVSPDPHFVTKLRLSCNITCTVASILGAQN